MGIHALRACALAATALVPAAAVAQTGAPYPVKPIRMIVASPPAGPADIVARLIGPRLTEAWSQTVVIDNRAGANGIVGTELAVRAAPDGYTIVMVAAGLAINPSLYGKVPFDALRDLAPVTQAISVSNTLVVHPSVPARSVQALVAAARQKPGGLAFASAGNGTSGHLALELFKQTAKADLTHVPYKGGGPALAELIGGQVSGLFSITLAAAPHVKADRLRALAVTSARRSAVLPDVPTVAESGYSGYEVTGWFGVLAPAATPRQIVERLHGQIVRSLRLPDVSDRLAGQGAEVVAGTPAQFAAHIRDETAKWAQVIRTAGIRGD
jgi:tripartite-type tricarboxylate transporter receptor subunit TctC